DEEARSARRLRAGERRDGLPHRAADRRRRRGALLDAEEPVGQAAGRGEVGGLSSPEGARLSRMASRHCTFAPSPRSCGERGRRRCARGQVAAFAIGFVALLLLAISDAAAQAPLPVVASTTDLKALVEVVGGVHVAVASIAPATMDAEDYSPKPQDVARVAGARLAVRVGLDYDIWFDRLLAQAGRADLMRGQ